MTERNGVYKDRINKTVSNCSSTALAAVALQDHWVRTLSLGKTFGPKHVSAGAATRLRQKKEIKSVVDCGRVKKSNKSGRGEEEEYVLDAKPPPLTLAQKFGLIDAPQQLLTEEEWRGVKGKSNKRDDSQQPCVICKEDFGLQQQVLLSCSHVFHRACLQAFERYTGKKTCPMCRHEQYQSRIIHEGSKQYQLKCATIIQSVWRGYVVRCWYTKFRQSVPPSDAKLRKKYFEDKLQSITDRMVRSCDFNVNNFLLELDQSLEASRNVFKNFDAMFNLLSEEQWEEIQLKAVVRENLDCPICLQDLAEYDENINNTKPNDAITGAKNINGSVLSDRINNQKTKSKNSKLQSPKHVKQTTDSSGKGKFDKHECELQSVVKLAKRKRRTVLLSCSHVFHETCLTTLEELTIGDLRNLCPVCRTVYQKKLIEI